MSPWSCRAGLPSEVSTGRQGHPRGSVGEPARFCVSSTFPAKVTGTANRARFSPSVWSHISGRCP